MDLNAVLKAKIAEESTEKDKILKYQIELFNKFYSEWMDGRRSDLKTRRTVLLKGAYHLQYALCYKI